MTSRAALLSWKKITQLNCRLYFSFNFSLSVVNLKKFHKLCSPLLKMFHSFVQYTRNNKWFFLKSERWWRQTQSRSTAAIRLVNKVTALCGSGLSVAPLQRLCLRLALCTMAHVLPTNQHRARQKNFCIPNTSSDQKTTDRTRETACRAQTQGSIPIHFVS